MSANQKPPYRPAPVTQRDGSKLQTSNCRMASIATGLDFDTLGKKKSTGAKMRAAQSDQDGGTDSGDAQRAWRNGYDEILDVQDGNSWVQALADLQSFRLVHLDVWHATVGNAPGSCVSGGGNYGHTIAVLPDCLDNQWLVADPWCNPPKWGRVSESKLKAGAEEWGRRVYGAATSGPGRDWQRDPPTIEELRAAAKALMHRFHAGGNEDYSEDPGDTGGPQRVMYTVTTSRPPSKGKSDVGILFNMMQWKASKDIPVYLDTSGATKVTTIKTGAVFSTLGLKAAVDSDGYDSSWISVRVTTGNLLTGDQPARNAVLWAKRADLPADPLPTPSGWDTGVWSLMNTPAGVFPCPPIPAPGPGNCSDEVTKALNARDDAWREWLLAGAPGQRDGPTG